MRAKKGDFFIAGNYVGRIVGIRKEEDCVEVSWLYKPPNAMPLTIQRLSTMSAAEPIPKDVAHNLAEVLKRNERSE